MSRKTDFFLHLWETRPHKSEISGKPLNYDFGYPMYFVFSHVVSKGSYKPLEFFPENIIFMTFEEHFLYEFKDYEIKNTKEWKWVFEKKEQLISEYHHLKKGLLLTPKLLKNEYK